MINQSMKSFYASIFYLKPCRKSINPKLYRLSTLIPSIGNRKSQRHELAKLLQSPCTNDNPIVYFKSNHGRIIVSGFQFDTLLANILINAYSKCGCVVNARLLFDTMPDRNLSSWSSMISTYTQHGYNEEAWMVFLEFQRNCEGYPNEYVLASVLRASTQLGSVIKGSQLHSFVVKTGLDQDVHVGTSLLNFYLKNGYIEDGRLVFDALPIKSEVTWTTIIAGYARIGKSDVSLQLFSQMRQSHVIPDRYVLSSALSSCSDLGFFEGGKQVHGFVLRRGAEMDESVRNALMDFYVKCGKVRIARKLFDEMIGKNVISWTTMISGYMQNSFDWEAMSLFVDMTRDGWRPDGFICSSILTSCGSLEALDPGRVIHGYAVKVNLDKDEFVNNGLMDMYSKCNSLTDARRAFNEMGDHYVIGYNAMIQGFSRQVNLNEALDLFHGMRLRSIAPSLLTFISLLGISASLLSLELSRQIHGLVIKYGVFLDVFLGSALIDVYSKCSSTVDAKLVFDEMTEKDIVVWNAMLFGYAQNSENENALRLYQELQLSCQKPNDFTFVALISVASNLTSLPYGCQFHAQLLKAGLELYSSVTNALMDMYAKCGSKQEAQKLFDSTIWRDVACWNSMILTYAQHGEAKEALKMFKRMVDEGIQPNYVTFVAVLSACDHMGLVEDGFHHFESMSSFGIEPGIEHYACMVSLLGRAGKLYEAKDFIEKLPISPAAVLWRSLLSACEVAGNVELGKHAAEMAILIDPKDSGSYILLSNIFASKGMWGEVKKVRQRMECNRAVKESGCSWI